LIGKDQAQTQLELAVALAEQGKLEEAVAGLRAILQAQPHFAKAHYNLGVALAQQGKPEEAAASFRAALGHRPDYAEAHYGLGNVFSEQGKLEEAAACFRQALSIHPGYADAANNLGLALADLEQWAEAVVMLRHAARLRPDDCNVLNNLGLALAGLGKFAEAEAAYEHALRLEPRFADAHCNLGSTYKESGRLEEALACYQLALWLEPGSASTHFNRALTWLQMGNYEQGWPEYEWRWKRKRSRPCGYRQPLWDGSPLQGRTILLHLEQGLGDTFQFLRFVPLVKDRGGRVLLACPESLRPLLATCPGIDELVPASASLPHFDVHCPLLSLPLVFGTTLPTVPVYTPYLFADSSLVEHWRQKLSTVQGRKIGIAWHGNPRHKGARHLAVPLREFAPLAKLPGVQLISLQKGPGAEQVQANRGHVPVIDYSADLDETTGAFMDTAAIIRNVDLVVSSDTSIAHLAGALGVPVWVALAASADWRWLLEREDSPWYPGMRLFRQTAWGAWRAVFERMATQLAGTS
jgi:tetratricopeptide (TPR) repeat protein